MIDNIINNLIDVPNDNTIEVLKDLIQNFNLATINKYTLQTYSSIELEKRYVQNEQRYSENFHASYYGSAIFELINTIFR